MGQRCEGYGSKGRAILARTAFAVVVVCALGLAASNVTLAESNRYVYEAKWEDIYHPFGKPPPGYAYFSKDIIKASFRVVGQPPGRSQPYAVCYSFRAIEQKPPYRSLPRAVCTGRLAHGSRWDSIRFRFAWASVYTVRWWVNSKLVKQSRIKPTE